MPKEQKFLIAFNNTLKQLLDQLSKLFPDFVLFETAVNMFHTGLLVSKETYIKEFHERIYTKHKKELLGQNTNFFLALTEFDMFPETAELKELYFSMTPENVETCWKYVSLLTKLTGKYYS